MDRRTSSSNDGKEIDKFENCNYVSHLISVYGKFNVGPSQGVDPTNIGIRSEIAKALEFSFDKNGVDKNDSFQIKNTVAFRMKGNALTVAARNDRIDFLYQHLVGQNDLIFNSLEDVFVDFIDYFSKETKILFYKISASKTIVLNHSFIYSESFLCNLFKLYNKKTNEYSAITAIDIDRVQLQRSEEIRTVRTLSFGLIKEKNNSKAAIQVDITSNSLNVQPRFFYSDIKKFIRIANDKINEKIQETLDLVYEYAKKE